MTKTKKKPVSSAAARAKKDAIRKIAEGYVDAAMLQAQANGLLQLRAQKIERAIGKAEDVFGWDSPEKLDAAYNADAEGLKGAVDALYKKKLEELKKAQAEDAS